MKQREIVDWDAEISRDEEVEYLADEPVEKKADSIKKQTVVEENADFLEEIEIIKE